MGFCENYVEDFKVSYLKKKKAVTAKDLGILHTLFCKSSLLHAPFLVLEVKARAEPRALGKLTTSELPHTPSAQVPSKTQTSVLKTPSSTETHLSKKIHTQK